MGDQPKEIEAFEEALNKLNGKIKGLEEGGNLEKKTIDSELVRMYGQLALFKDKTEKMGVDNSQLNQTVQETGSLISKAVTTGQKVSGDLTGAGASTQGIDEVNRLVPLMLNTEKKAQSCKGCSGGGNRRQGYRGAATGTRLSPLLACALASMLAFANFLTSA